MGFLKLLSTRRVLCRGFSNQLKNQGELFSSSVVKKSRIKHIMGSEVEAELQFSSGDMHNVLDSKFNPPEEFFDSPRLIRRQSTLEDEQRMIILLQEVLEDQNKNVSSWIVENQVKALLFNYKCLLPPHKEGFLKVLATKYSVDHERIYKALNQFKDFEPGSTLFLKAEEQLKSVLTPQYSWLFKIIGKLEKGVKFLVDLRTDVLELLGTMPQNDAAFVPLQHLNNSLKDLLSMWFSVGFLNLERVTWKSPCEMLQKISEYEAVHPVRSWADLKRRVGRYRRCYVFTHSSMPEEPLVVLHTALATEIASTLKGLVATTHRMSMDTGSVTSMFGNVDTSVEDPLTVKAGVFYSISSTQKGLQGIELGNYLIKRVVSEIQTEFPKATEFSSLSPIPPFRAWLLDKIKSKEKGVNEVVLGGEGWSAVLEKFNSSWQDVRRALLSNTWHNDCDVAKLLQEPLLAVCAHYLFKEKRRGFALDSVANFHLRNGAVMWRLNWLADTSPRGMTNSCGLMVNYRYFLEDVENNSRIYLEQNEINASDQILKLVGVRLESKM